MADYQPLFREKALRNAHADAFDRFNRKHGSHTIHFAGMFSAAETVPTRISFTVIPEADDFR